jgi:hypothetical protein
MIAIICTLISALLGGLLVALFSRQASRTVGDVEEKSGIAIVERRS